MTGRGGQAGRREDGRWGWGVAWGCVCARASRTKRGGCCTCPGRRGAAWPRARASLVGMRRVACFFVCAASGWLQAAGRLSFLVRLPRVPPPAELVRS